MVCLFHKRWRDATVLSGELFMAVADNNLTVSEKRLTAILHTDWSIFSNFAAINQ